GFSILLVGLFGFVVGYRSRDDYVLPWFPVDRRRHLMFRGQLERVDYAQHFIEIAPGGHRVNDDQLDLLVGPDDENVAHGQIVHRRALGRITRSTGGKHPIELGDSQIGVSYEWIVRREALGLFDVGRPFRVRVHRVDAKTDNLGVAFVELRLESGHVPQFGGAHRGEILRVREQYAPG